MADDEKTRWAIDVMTAWAHDDEGFVRERIDAYADDERDGLVVGLVNLAGLLLSGMELSTGRSTPEILRAIAATIARHEASPGR